MRLPRLCGAPYERRAGPRRGARCTARGSPGAGRGPHWVTGAASGGPGRHPCEPAWRPARGVGGAGAGPRHPCRVPSRVVSGPLRPLHCRIAEPPLPIAALRHPSRGASPVRRRAPSGPRAVRARLEKGRAVSRAHPAAGLVGSPRGRGWFWPIPRRGPRGSLRGSRRLRAGRLAFPTPPDGCGASRRRFGHTDAAPVEGDDPDAAEEENQLGAARAISVGTGRALRVHQ